MAVATGSCANVVATLFTPKQFVPHIAYCAAKQATTPSTKVAEMWSDPNLGWVQAFANVWGAPVFVGESKASVSCLEEGKSDSVSGLSGEAPISRSGRLDIAEAVGMRS